MSSVLETLYLCYLQGRLKVGMLFMLDKTNCSRYFASFRSQRQQAFGAKAINNQCADASNLHLTAHSHDCYAIFHI